MKRRIPLLPVALLGMLLAACSADPTQIVVLSARAPGTKCDFSDDTKYVSSGSLDLRPYIVGTAPNTTTVVTSGYCRDSWDATSCGVWPSYPCER